LLAFTFLTSSTSRSALFKPFRDQDMLDAVVMATERDRKRREVEKVAANLQALFETLTSREREILALVPAGLMNKQIAAELGLAENTVKIHRGHIMKKMGARSLADLIRMALGSHPARWQRFKYRPRGAQVGRPEAPRKSIVHRRKDLPRLVVPAPPNSQACNSRCAPQFPHQRALKYWSAVTAD
jgi:DNA-binding CsgD family transcriptional regulator